MDETTIPSTNSLSFSLASVSLSHSPAPLLDYNKSLKSKTFGSVNSRPDISVEIINLCIPAHDTG